MFGIGAKKKAKAKKAALARLAASEVASLMNRSIEMTKDGDRQAAADRIAKVLDLKDSPLSQLDDGKIAEGLREVIVARLRRSELNINFPAHTFFANKKPAEKYATKFEIMRTTGAPMGDTRNDAEERMFNYSGNLRIDTNTADPGHLAAALRAEDFGRLNSANFAGAIRPKYCSVNFPELKDGMGAQWGKSHLVLADHLKPNMTFTHSDSFDVVSGSKMDEKKSEPFMANYHHMNRLIINMPEKMLIALIDTVSGDLPRGMACADFQKQYQLGSSAYIEGHIHAEVYFARDVKKIRVDRSEIFKLDGWQKKIERFLGKINVPIEYFN